MNSRHSSDEPRLIIIGDYLFDPRDGLLSGPTGSHHICRRLTALLTQLLEHPCRVLSRQQLIESLWPDDPDGSRTLTQSIGRLRSHLGDSARKANYIETVPRRGYRLIAPVYGSTSKAAVYRPTTDPSSGGGSRLYGLIREFRDRKVCRAILVYSIVVWLVFQISEIVVPALSLPDWVNTLVVVLGLLGFPIAATLAWIFDLTPSGLVREGGHAAGNSAAPVRRRSDFVFDTVLVAVALAICALLLLSSMDAGFVSLSEAKAFSGSLPAPVEAFAGEPPGASCVELFSQAD